LGSSESELALESVRGGGGATAEFLTPSLPPARGKETPGRGRKRKEMEDSQQQSAYAKKQVIFYYYFYKNQ
jgi:hypothetical protein